VKIVLQAPADVRADWERAFAPAFMVVLLAALAASAWLPPSLTPRCTFRRLTGLACPTCGSFRAAGLLARGRVVEAARIQPLITGGTLVGVGGSLYALIVTTGRFRRVRLVGVTRRDGWLLAGGAAGLVAANWVYLIRWAI
jgi:hypothetical protein